VSLAHKVAVVVALAACEAPIADQADAYYTWDDRKVHCAVEIDDEAHNSLDSILGGVDHAKQEGSVLELLVHEPGTSMSWAEFEQVLAGIQQRGVPFLTVKDMLTGPPTAGVALMYDDAWVSEWVKSMDLIAKYDAKVTLYVAYYDRLQPDERDELHQLAAAGFDIEAHSVNHIRGAEYVENNGLDAYLDDEVVPSIDVLNADGYDVVSYAYPFGMRTDEIDRAILATGKVQTLRALAETNRLREATCPY
jgi:hypothetical protein